MNERLAEQQGVAYAKTVAEAMNLKLDADNHRPREIAPGNSRSCRWEKNAKAKGAWLKFSRSLWSWVCVSAIDFNGRRGWIADAHQGDEKRCLKKNASVMRIRPRSPYEGLASPRRQPPARYLSSAICAAAQPLPPRRNRAAIMSSPNRDPKRARLCK